MELYLTAILCAHILGGETEVRHDYMAVDRAHHIRVDCETPTHVIEVGRDVKSARDSVHQALWAARLTGKLPAVVLIDTDGVEDAVERQVKEVARAAGVPFHVYKIDYLRRVAALHLMPGFRADPPDFARVPGNS